jgi:hypothetical protein
LDFDRIGASSLNGVMATLFVLELSIYRLQEWTEKGIPRNQPRGSCIDILHSGKRAKSITKATWLVKTKLNLYAILFFEKLFFKCFLYLFVIKKINQRKILFS